MLGSCHDAATCWDDGSRIPPLQFSYGPDFWTSTHLNSDIMMIRWRGELSSTRSKESPYSQRPAQCHQLKE